MLVGLYQATTMGRVYVTPPVPAPRPLRSADPATATSGPGRAHQLRIRAITRRAALRGRPGARQMQGALRKGSTVPL